MKLNLGCGDKLLPSPWVNVDQVLCVGEEADPGELEFVCADLRERLPFDDGEADEVLLEHVLEHLWLEEAGTLLAECARVLGPGGILRIVTPDPDAIGRAWIGRLVDHDVLNAIIFGWKATRMERERSLGMMHKRLWSREELATTLLKAGFKACSAESVSGEHAPPPLAYRLLAFRA